MSLILIAVINISDNYIELPTTLMSTVSVMIPTRYFSRENRTTTDRDLMQTTAHLWHKEGCYAATCTRCCEAFHLVLKRSSESGICRIPSKSQHDTVILDAGASQSLCCSSSGCAIPCSSDSKQHLLTCKLN